MKGKELRIRQKTSHTIHCNNSRHQVASFWWVGGAGVIECKAARPAGPAYVAARYRLQRVRVHMRRCVFIWGSICQNPVTYMSWWSPKTIPLKIYNYACHRVSPEQVFINSAMFILYFCLTLPFYFSFYKHIWTEIVHGSLTASLFCFFCFFVFFAKSN